MPRNFPNTSNTTSTFGGTFTPPENWAFVDEFSAGGPVSASASSTVTVEVDGRSSTIRRRPLLEGNRSYLYDVFPDLTTNQIKDMIRLFQDEGQTVFSFAPDSNAASPYNLTHLGGHEGRVVAARILTLTAPNPGNYDALRALARNFLNYERADRAEYLNLNVGDSGGTRTFSEVEEEFFGSLASAASNMRSLMNALPDGADNSDVGQCFMKWHKTLKGILRHA